MTSLLDNVSVDIVGVGQSGDGGNKVLAVWCAPTGSFGGGSVTIQGSPDNGVTWITLTHGGNPAIFTSNIILTLDRIGQGMLVRATLSGSSGASYVSATLSQ